jgi:hypothetical protein
MRWIVGMWLAVCCATAFAGESAEVRKQVEASMWVTGSVDVDAQGAVTGFRLKDPDKLPPAVVALVEQRAPDWLFEAHRVQGAPVASTAAMNLRILAKRSPAEEERYTLDIVGAGFYVKPKDPAEQLQSARLIPPTFPQQALDIGAGGTVYLLLKVGRDGTVEDGVAEQVNLRYVTDEPGMARLRRQFANAALVRAKGWKFQPPTAGESAGDPFWTVRVPVVFTLYFGASKPAYGEWESYVPGPRERAPWLPDAAAGLAFSPDALPEGGAYPLGDSLKLRADPGS